MTIVLLELLVLAAAAGLRREPGAAVRFPVAAIRRQLHLWDRHLAGLQPWGGPC